MTSIKKVNTHLSCVSCGTITLERFTAHRSTNALIQTGRVYGAIVDFSLTVLSSEVGGARTCVVVDEIVTCTVIEARFVNAFVIVGTAILA